MPPRKPDRCVQEPNVLLAKQENPELQPRVQRGENLQDPPRIPPGSLTRLRTLCRSTFIQYSCFSGSAVFYIPAIKRKLRPVSPDLFPSSDGSLEVGQLPPSAPEARSAPDPIGSDARAQPSSKHGRGASGRGRGVRGGPDICEDFMAPGFCCWAGPVLTGDRLFLLFGLP